MSQPIGQSHGLSLKPEPMRLLLRFLGERQGLLPEGLGPRTTVSVLSSHVA